MQNYFLFGIFIQFCQYFMQIYITLVRASAKFEIDESEYIDIIFINKSFFEKRKGTHYVAHNHFLYYVIRKNVGQSQAHF